MILPFNLICKITNRCNPIVFSYYLPKILGERDFEIFFEASNNSPKVDFRVLERSLIVRAGDDAKIDYAALNITNSNIKIRPIPYILPQEAAKYIRFYECLCFKERSILKGKELILPVKFRLDRKIEQDEFFKTNPIIRVGYKVE